MKVAVLGSGFMGGTHARAYAKLHGVEVVGVSSRSEAKAQELAEEVGAEPYTDAMALATHADVEALSVTLPTHLHEEYVTAALQAGKHVFVEKPMALDVDACDRMIRAADDAERTLAVAHVLRFWPDYEALAEVVKSGRLGKPLTAHARRLSTRPAWGDWFTDPEKTGGGLHDMMVHDFDVLAWLFGSPERVFARGVRGEPGGWDHVFAVLDYGDVQAMAEGSVMMPADYPFTMALWVTCDEGAVEFTFRAGGTGVETGEAGGTNLVVYPNGGDPEPVQVADHDAYEEQVRVFVECVGSGRSPERGTPTQGREAVRVARAARRSLDEDLLVTP